MCTGDLHSATSVSVAPASSTSVRLDAVDVSKNRSVPRPECPWSGSASP